jgi:hypothetical protein
MSTADALNGTASQLLARYTLKELSRKAARKAETDTILDVLSHTHWNRKRAAALLKTSYRTLLSKIKEYEIQQRPTALEDAIGKTRHPAEESFVGYLERAQKGTNRSKEPRALGRQW